ncbi:hypothetical protein Forpi1262_v002287 [Fusarium oxysporum f. sp. raphani]|uniref:Uncharacterized protein n=1 Tax=Fusarium oxysporum f. sp. raphani TaxID=96318 RepID=A0A8J5UPW1_FUSOX|nr:hypothetical protein Forpi1262_v002287 [Fusarium oxysporum f. sp. raphani]
MCSNFLADINNNHAQECRVDWGPRFVCGIKAITALGQLLLVTRLELDVSTLEVPGSYDNRRRLTTAGEKIQSCSRLYLEAFAKSEQSLTKLSSTAWELASSRGSLHRVTELFRKRGPAVTLSSFQDEWERVHRHLTNVEQHARASFESWTCLLSFIQEFESLINNMIKTLNKKDTQRFDFTYAIPLLIALVLVLFFSGLLVRAIILSGMFLYALLILREGLEQSGYRTTLDEDIEDETRDLETLSCKNFSLAPAVSALLG